MPRRPASPTAGLPPNGSDVSTISNTSAGVTATGVRNYPAPPWVVGILQGIRAPVNQANVLALEFWAQQEGDGVQNNNPFNVADCGAGYVPGSCYAQCPPAGDNECDSAYSPIFRYATMQDGVNHNVNQFLLSNPGLMPAVEAMQGGESLTNIYRALNGYFGQQSWASPTYPTTLYDYLNGGGAGPKAPYSSGATSSYTYTSPVGTGANTESGGTSGCAAKGQVFGFDTVVFGTIGLNHCQLKAILGGLGVVGGGLVMLGGAALLVVGGLGKGGVAAPVVAAALPVARKAQSVAGAPRRRREGREATANAQSRDRAKTVGADKAAIKRVTKPRVSPPEPNSRPARTSPSTSGTSSNRLPGQARKTPKQAAATVAARRQSRPDLDEKPF